MIKWLCSLFKKHDKRFPLKVKEYWYCGIWYMYLADLSSGGKKITSLDPDDIESPVRDQIAFNPWHIGLMGKDSSGLIDGLIPAIRVDDKIGLYRQTCAPYQTKSFYDVAMWDDGCHIDMKFVRTIPVGGEDENHN